MKLLVLSLWAFNFGMWSLLYRDTGDSLDLTLAVVTGIMTLVSLVRFWRD